MTDDLNSNHSSGISLWRALIQRLRIIRRRIWIPIVVLIVSFSSVLLYNFSIHPPGALTQDEIEQRIADALASATPPPPHSAEVFEIILPSLISIRTIFENHSDDEGFGIGSGVAINADGQILTAFHVVADAMEIEVFYPDGNSASAEILSADPENDMAILIPTSPPGLIVPAVLGNPFAMQIGDEAYAVGNPFGFTHSMSAGVISGFNRSLTVKESGLELNGLIQFDTAINPGSSGGPLLNRQGQVIGIVTGLANPTEQVFFIGLGFAVPIMTAVSAGGGPQH